MITFFPIMLCSQAATHLYNMFRLGLMTLILYHLATVFTAIYCAWVMQFREIVHCLFSMQLFIHCNQSFTLSRSDDFRLLCTQRYLNICSLACDDASSID